LFAVAPFGFSLFERDNFLTEDFSNAGVLGDVTAGVVHQLPDIFPHLPQATFSVNATIPTGANNLNTLQDNQASLGNGVWRLGVGLNFVESLDPVVCFAGVGWDYPFATKRESLTLQYGNSYTYYVGLGFAVSDDISLSGQVSGSWQDTTSLGGIKIPNSDIEPVSMRVGLVRRINKKSRVQPYVTHGLTRDAPDFGIGVRYTVDE
jgi:hypothetical protein